MAPRRLPLPQALLAALLLGLATAQQQGEPAQFEDLALETVAEGFTAPVALTSPEGDARRFVVDQAGQIWIIDENGELLDEPFLDVSDRMVDLNEGYDERGLLGLAFHPRYADNGRFYVYYSAPLRDAAPDGWNHTARISGFTVSSSEANRADPESEEIVLQVDQPQTNHNGGALAFGPDGYLYVALGDGGAANDVGTGHPPLGNGQDVTTLLGSILRIDVDAEGQGYAIPDDNPLVGQPLPHGPRFAGDEPRGEIYAWGFRNPFRLSFDRLTGDLWVGDVGQALFEEVDLIREPGNYGWNLMEGRHPFDPGTPASLPDGPAAETGPMGEPLQLPTLEYAHPNAEIEGVESRGTTVIGGYVYRGGEIPWLQGAYVFGDWNGGSGGAAPDGKLFVATADDDGEWSFALDRGIGHYVLALGEDSRGELYLLTTDSVGPSGNTGAVRRLVASPGE